MAVRRALAALALLAASCAPSRSSDVTTPPLAPAPAHGRCDVSFQVDWTAPSESSRAVTIYAENVSRVPLDFDLPDRCPHPLIGLDGLPGELVERLSCNMGACPGPRPPVHVHLAPRERRLLSTIELPLDGSPCVPPLPVGVYDLRPVVPPLPLPTCYGSAPLDLVARGPRPYASAPPSRPSPAPPVTTPAAPPVNPADPYSCSSPADCVLSCPSAPGCCGWPCGCQHAIRRDHAAAFEASYAKTCSPRAPHCPDVACMYEPAIFATCRGGRCVGATSLSGF